MLHYNIFQIYNASTIQKDVNFCIKGKYYILKLLTLHYKYPSSATTAEIFVTLSIFQCQECIPYTFTCVGVKAWVVMNEQSVSAGGRCSFMSLLKPIE